MLTRAGGVVVAISMLALTVGAVTLFSPPESPSDCVVTILNSEGRPLGQGVPIDRWHLLTANHVPDGPISWRLERETGVAKIQLRRQSRDIVLLYSETPLPCHVQLSDDMPRPAEKLSWTVMLPNGTLAKVNGNYIGIDPFDGDMVVDGTTYPGTSGAPMFTADGRLIAITHAAGFMSARPPQWRFRSLTYAIPVVAGRGGMFKGDATMLDFLGTP